MRPSCYDNEAVLTRERIVQKVGYRCSEWGFFWKRTALICNRSQPPPPPPFRTEQFEERGGQSNTGIHVKKEKLDPQSHNYMYLHLTLHYIYSFLEKSLSDYMKFRMYINYMSISTCEWSIDRELGKIFTGKNSDICFAHSWQQFSPSENFTRNRCVLSYNGI